MINNVLGSRISFYTIFKSTRHNSQERQDSDLSHGEIDWFLTNFEKSPPSSSQGITHKINVGSTTLHLVFKPQSKRLSYLSVKVEHPDFPVSEMETNGSDITEPLRYLAYLDPEDVQNMMFGKETNVPHFPDTAAHIIDMANAVGSGRYEFSVHEAKILRTKTSTALENFDGDHQDACDELIEDLLDYGFQKPENMIQTRANPMTIDFMKRVWAPVKSHLKEEIEAGRLSSLKSDSNNNHSAEHPVDHSVDRSAGPC